MLPHKQDVFHGFHIYANRIIEDICISKHGESGRILDRVSQKITAVHHRIKDVFFSVLFVVVCVLFGLLDASLDEGFIKQTLGVC